ncbi:flagellar hook-associated protein FlgK [Salmonella enterica subsp. enterica serovar Muenchen]|nr:flagellar hook-associated protein FlgK [Salmonella enterica subsp. enterica serovar Muenchen]
MYVFKALAGIVLALVATLAHAERIRDLTSVQGVRENSLIGYGLVVGLDGTGDQTTQTPFTTQTLNNMLSQLGITVPTGTNMQLKNVAAVMVTASYPPFARQGQTIDVVVSSMGNAKSLRGGTLLMTPLKGVDSQVYALAQGNILVGGAGASAGGSSVQVNQLNGGRITNGAIIERELPTQFGAGNTINLQLNDEDFTMAQQITDAINRARGYGSATALDAQINNYAKQIANLNDQISRMTGVGAGASPNDLLDQRDQLVSELNKIVGVEVSVQDGGTYNLTMANGYTLVQGSTARQLAAVPSSADPTRTTVAYVDEAAGNIEIPEKLLNTGSLGGLLTFRSQDLDQTRNTLGQLALAFADAFNAQHTKGYDADGNKGKDFFSIGSPVVYSNSNNADKTVSLTAKVVDSTKVQATDYKIVFDGTDWQVTRTADNTTFTATKDADGKLEIDGLKVTVGTGAQKNDSFLLKPVSNAIVDMNVKVTNEAEIAMASESKLDPDVDTGDSDNRNGQALLDLQNSNVVGGNKTFNDAYATLVSDVGNKTSTLKTSSTTQANVVKQLYKQQQSVSGVNLDEEYGNLQRYQQYYLANAQVLQTANALFDALLNIR